MEFFRSWNPYFDGHFLMLKLWHMVQKTGKRCGPIKTEPRARSGPDAAGGWTSHPDLLPATRADGPRPALAAGEGPCLALARPAGTQRRHGATAFWGPSLRALSGNLAPTFCTVSPEQLETAPMLGTPLSLFHHLQMRGPTRPSSRPNLHGSRTNFWAWWEGVCNVY